MDWARSGTTRPEAQDIDLDLSAEGIRAIGTANLASDRQFCRQRRRFGFEASNPVDGTTREKRTPCGMPAGGGALQARLGLRTSCLRPPLAGPWPLTPMGTC